MGGVDTGFGLSLSGRDAAGTIVFADVEQNEVSEDVGAIQMEEVRATRQESVDTVQCPVFSTG